MKSHYTLYYFIPDRLLIDLFQNIFDDFTKFDLVMIFYQTGITSLESHHQSKISIPIINHFRIHFVNLNPKNKLIFNSKALLPTPILKPGLISNDRVMTSCKCFKITVCSLDTPSNI